MTKDELKPIDVSKYKVTEAGQVLKMAKDELEKEARDYDLEWGNKTDGTYACCRDGYLAGAKPREKRIVELEEQVEDLESDHEYNLELMKGLNEKIAELKEDLRNKKLAIQNRNGRIKELEEEISVLLSCKNCPENKGGYICEKEYEDKCLAQKMQYIKELQEENAELKEEMKAKQVVLNDFKSRVETVIDRFNKKSSQLTKAKEIIRELLNSCFGYNSKTVNYEVKVKAEQFLKDVSE